MTGQTDASTVWGLVRRQHGVISRDQLRRLKYSDHAIDHRVASGRLHPLFRGVFAVGRPDVGRRGVMMAAVLACGAGALISHETAAELWRIRRPERGPLEVSVPRARRPRRTGIRVHQRTILGPAAMTEREGVPVTSVPLVLIDLAAHLSRPHLEAAVNMADSMDLLDAEYLRTTLEDYPRVRGVAPLRRLLERDAFRLTDSELERMFRRLVDDVGLPVPETRRHTDGFRVDFVWPEVGLVVETDSLRYHRTAISQRRDAARDHAHLFADRESVRFTHYQVAYEKTHVRRALLKAWRKALALQASLRPA
jgi:very-short-patch-repair endonuclease